MKKLVKGLGLLCAIGLCALGIGSILWIRQYQSLADDEPTVVFNPNVADITYCTADSVALKLDLYYPETVPAPYPVLVYVHGGSFNAGDKRKGSGVADIRR